MTRLTVQDDPEAAPSLFGGVAMPPQGSYACVDCGVPLPLPGICPTCNRREAVKAQRARLVRAEKSIPPTWRWATTTAFALSERLLGISDPTHAKPDPTSIKAAIDIIFDEARRMLANHHLLVLWGESGFGKTTIASALLQEAIARGRAENATARDVDMAARCRFLDAGHIAGLDRLGREVGDKPDVEDQAFYEERASLLVVDNMGVEFDGCPPGTPLGAMRAKTTREIVGRRVAEGRDTIVTTWMGEAEVGRLYGGGFARLLYRVNPCNIELVRIGGAS